MGTHPIFESDFDCLTDSMFRTRALPRVKAHRLSQFSCTRTLCCSPAVAREEQLVSLAQRKSSFSEDEIKVTEEDETLYRGVDIMLAAHSDRILDSYGEFIKLVAGELDVHFDGFTDPLCHGDKWLVNKSPFIYGKHKIEYEARTYKKVVHLQYLTESTRQILLYYIESQVPPGVAIEVRSYKLLEMPSKMKKAILNETLEDYDIAENERILKLDNMESRKARKEQFQIYRKPRNPSEYDWRRTEVSQRKRRLRTPNTKKF